MEYPDDLYYTQDHIWVRLVGDRGIIGITDYAQQEMGEILYVDLPEKGAVIEPEEIFGTLESAKTVAELFSPVGGEINRINEDLEDEPSLINDDPYGKGWLINLVIGDMKELDNLLNGAEYEEMLEKKGKNERA